MDENKRIVICRRCKKPEYWGEMRWLSGFCVCRDCYKAQWESENHKPYTWEELRHICNIRRKRKRDLGVLRKLFSSHVCRC